MAVGDHTGQIWLSGFNEIGKVLFGISGDELHEIQVSPLLCGNGEIFIEFFIGKQ